MAWPTVVRARCARPGAGQYSSDMVRSRQNLGATVRWSRVVLVAALWLGACTIHDPHSGLPSNGGAGASAGNGQELGGASSAGSNFRAGSAGYGTGGTQANPAGANSGGEPEAAAGSGPTEGCQANQICATVTVGTELPSGLKRLAVVLYETKPVITGDGSPWPFASYEPLSDVTLSESQPFVLQQDFTVPAWGGKPSGERFVAVVAFFSNEERQGVPGVDYWFVSPEALTLEPGKMLDLGNIQLKLMPVADDLDSGGNDAAGVVWCLGRLHDAAGADATGCDVTAKTCCLAEGGGRCGASSCALDGSDVELACDGSEDCAEGEVCCGEPLAAHRCVAAAACKAKRACHSSDDCDSASSVCVIATTGIADIAYCVGPNPSTPGDDRPEMVQCFPSTTTCRTGCCVDKVSSAAQCAPSCSGTSETINVLSCDGPEDCSQGQRCCQSASGGRTCGTTCSAVVCCHVDADCPQGKCGTDGQCSLQ
jgi:hypothetical protein